LKRKYISSGEFLFEYTYYARQGERWYGFKTKARVIDNQITKRWHYGEV